MFTLQPGFLLSVHSPRSPSVMRQWWAHLSEVATRSRRCESAHSRKDLHRINELIDYGWEQQSFLLFAKFLVTRFGLNPIHDLLPLREYLGSGQNAPIGFYYFYAAELLVPLGILMWDVVEPRRVRYLVVSAFAFGSLLLTSGRTNAITSILLTAVALLIRRGDTRIKPRVLLVTGGIFVLGLGIIIGIGNIEGKTFANSSILTYVTSTTWLPPQLTLPYVEFVGPIPALDQVVLGKPPLLSSTPLPDTHNQTFRPLYQLASIVDRNVKVPSNIQPFRSIPEPFNVYTALGPLWLDLGPIGTMFFMFGFGLICGKAYALWLRTPSLATLLLVALATTVAIVSVGDLRLDDLSVWVQGGALLILFLSDRSAKKPARRPSHLYGTRMTPADHLTGYVKQPLT